jgi:hypothetical protein
MGQARLGQGTRVFAIGVAAAAMASGAYAYTSSNTVDASRAGDGNNTITGYDVTDVEYDLDATDPSELELVRFTLDEPARSVRAKVDADTTDYSTCTETALSSQVWECDLDGVTVLAADELTVIATD